MRALLAVSFDALLIVRQGDRRILGASPSAQRLYGRTEPVLCELRYDDLVTDRTAVDEIFERHREHVPLRFHRRADGSRFPVALAIHWLSDPGGELACMCVRDLTQSEAEERRLRRELASRIDHLWAIAERRRVRWARNWRTAASEGGRLPAIRMSWSRS